MTSYLMELMYAKKIHDTACSITKIHTTNEHIKSKRREMSHNSLERFHMRKIDIVQSVAN